MKIPPSPGVSPYTARHILRASAVAAVALALSLAACGGQHETRSGPMPIDPQDRITRSINPALRETIGQYCTLVDSMPLGVEGWGVIANLHGTGSGDMDPKIRDYLVNQLVVNGGAGSHVNGTQNIIPEKILASSDIAVVEVRGLIPPLARKGTPFDLTVTAIAGSQTTSLANGLLWTSELKMRGLTVNQDDTSVIALGRGPVFISTPVESAAATAKDSTAAEPPRALRTGRIIGGGMAAFDREIRLQLYSPSARMTRVIEHVINSRFPGVRDKTAEAQDNSTITLRIPPEYNLNPTAFIDLVKHLYLSTDAPGFTEERAALLLKTFQDPAAPKRDLSLALQGLGRSILPQYIETQYTSENEELRFWCARAGACMQDSGGMIALQEIISNRASPFRKQAIDAMIEASIGRDTERASLTLARMLDSANTDDRIRAYQGLLAIRSRLVRTYKVAVTESAPNGKFLMDIVATDSPPMIYVSQTDAPRIAFIGRPLALPPGAVYVSPDRLLTVAVAVNALGNGTVPIAAGPDAAAANAKGKEALTLFYRPPGGGKAVTLKMGTTVPELISRAAFEPSAAERNPEPFVAATYQRLTEMLAALCRDEMLPAKFVLQPAPPPLLTDSEIINSGRPEGSVLPPPTSAPSASPTAPAGPSTAPRP